MARPLGKPCEAPVPFDERAACGEDPSIKLRAEHVGMPLPFRSKALQQSALCKATTAPVT